MEYQIRYAKPDEFVKITDLDGASFGFSYAPDALAAAQLDLELETILAAYDGDRIVGISGEVPFELTLPGGARVEVTGLSWVSVEVTHRRRGIGRLLMERQVRDAAERGKAALVLTASEGGIYGRYGYGVAQQQREVRIERAAARLIDRQREHGVQRLTTEDAREVLPAIYDRWRKATPGGLDRNERRWQFELLDEPWQRGGASALFHLVHPDGYVSYRVRAERGPTSKTNVCRLVDYVPITAEAHAGLWQVLLDLDLFGAITSQRLPLDDPLPLLLTDPRQVQTTQVWDGLWLRPIDIAALFGGRRYAVDIDVTLRVHDRLLGDATFRLGGGPDEAECVRVNDTAEPDLELDVADLGALALGGSRLTPYARAGRVIARDPLLLARLDRAVLGDADPQFGTHF